MPHFYPGCTINYYDSRRNLNQVLIISYWLIQVIGFLHLQQNLTGHHSQ